MSTNYNTKQKAISFPEGCFQNVKKAGYDWITGWCDKVRNDSNKFEELGVVFIKKYLPERD